MSCSVQPCLGIVTCVEEGGAMTSVLAVSLITMPKTPTCEGQRLPTTRTLAPCRSSRCTAVATTRTCADGRALSIEVEYSTHRACNCSVCAAGTSCTASTFRLLVDALLGPALTALALSRSFLNRLVRFAKGVRCTSFACNLRVIADIARLYLRSSIALKTNAKARGASVTSESPPVTCSTASACLLALTALLSILGIRTVSLYISSKRYPSCKGLMYGLRRKIEITEVQSKTKYNATFDLHSGRGWGSLLEFY
mmetsp:Transcript_9970/g.21289  ORF Transcript_9970/g.21289 Transcript_9970/m.21289 type:complete len:254 (+) Transcript_9970:296-1057(+)